MALNVWEMSDEELESAFREAKANLDSPITDVENNDFNNEIENDEIDVIDLEQPTEDSDDNGDEEVELDEGTDESDESEPLDEENKDEDEPTDEPEADEGDTTQEEQIYAFKANGKEFKFTEKEIKEQFPKIFGQAMDYTKKTQALKPWRQTIDALEQAKISHEDVSLMIDVLRGDKDAIATVIKRTGVDALELDPENSKYVPKSYGRNETDLAVKDVIQEISSDREYEITQKILSKDWDDNSVQELAKNPDLIRELHIDVKNGIYDKVSPIAEKLKVLDRGRKSDLEYYLRAGDEYYKSIQAEAQKQAAIENQRVQREAKLQKQAEIERVKAQQVARVKSTEKVEARKAAAPVKANAGTKKVIDYLDDSEEAYEEWYKEMESKR